MIIIVNYPIFPYSMITKLEIPIWSLYRKMKLLKSKWKVEIVPMSFLLTINGKLESSSLIFYLSCAGIVYVIDYLETKQEFFITSHLLVLVFVCNAP